MSAELYDGSGDVWRRITDRHVGAGGAWRQVKTKHVGSGGIWRLSYQRLFPLDISVDTVNYNVRAAALVAGWDGVSPIDVELTLNSGIYIRASSTANYAIDTGIALPTGSTLKFIFNWQVQGRGGNGSNGGSGTPTAGGHAINLQMPVTIDNGNGFIFGGGGGGRGGADASDECNCTKHGCTQDNQVGGGGGGGAGSGVAGTGGNNGVSGTNTGSSGAYGLGGAADGPGPCGVVSEAGARGGDWGENGQATSLGAGAVAGKAIQTNGNAITWLSGLDGTHVKGAVS